MAKRCEHCGKNAYPNLRAVIRVALNRSQEAGRPMRWYLCPHRTGWHLTSRVRPRREARHA